MDNRHEQVCQRIKIHNCRTSRTLQRRMPKNIRLTEQVHSGLCCQTTLLRPAYTTPKNLKTHQSAVIFCIFVCEQNAGREITWLSWRHRFRKAPFSKCFASKRKRKDGVFKSLLFEERYRKALFSWRISVGGRLDRRNNVAFSNFWGVLSTGP